MPENIRGPMCSSRCGSDWIDTGTSCRSRSFPPVTISDELQTGGYLHLDPLLVQRNRAIEESLLNAANNYLRRRDFRWFFTYAHGQITKQINKNIRRFEAPNALMLFNINFAEEFLSAIWGQPHRDWQQAFNRCEEISNASDELGGYAERELVQLCGAEMARIHINFDITTALMEDGCIPRQDFGNMLLLVNSGSQAAMIELRDRTSPYVEIIIGALSIGPIYTLVIQQLGELVVKFWRNAIYERLCNTSVPNPAPHFLSP